MTLGQPDVQAAFQSLADAGKEMAKYQQVIMKFGREAQAAGFPAIRGYRQAGAGSFTFGI